MDRSSEQQWITSLLQHKLGCENVAYVEWARKFSSRQLQMEGMSDLSQPGDIQEYRSEALAWEVALTAQSSAYLALELQVLAQRLSEMLIRSPESTYNQLYDSYATLRALLDTMTESLRETNGNGSDGSIPLLSSRMVAEIRSTLAQDTASTMGGSTTSTERVGRKNT
jgi:hypothetical protein